MSQIDECEQIEIKFEIDQIENGQSELDIEIGLNESNSDD